MGCVWVRDWDTEVPELAVISLLNQTVSVCLSNLPQRTLQCNLFMCDIVIPFHEQDTVLIVMRPNHSPLSLVLFPPPLTVW